ncbi:maleylpyruvate isomerase N-terminal domain-containing protein [Streptomyces sp. NPDC046881]|uniref:maleylpyruvate isomerase N-terminal domain-containing protein n=1 Tax=Streptomyces sp. NPDC046881 TaxID=3155374 RepID=UPI00341033D1
MLAHVRHSVDACLWLLRLARTGRAPGPRPDAAAPAAAVERDAVLPAGRLAGLLRESLDRFTGEADGTPAAAWDRLVPAPAGRRHPAWYLLLRCLRELETHHLDLGVGYGSEDWPERYVRWALDDTLGTLRERGFPLASVAATDLGINRALADEGPSVAGAGHRLLGRRTGRLTAEGLAVDGTAGSPPRPPAWPQPPLPGWGRVGEEEP